MKSQPKEGESAALIQAVAGLEKGSKLLFIFGPEGGLSPAEIESFEAKGAVLAGLGPRIPTSRNSTDFMPYQPSVFY